MMKKFYLFCLLLSLPWSVFSQHKHEFGFLVKTGNYALSSQEESMTDYSTQLNETNAGQTYTLGIWHAFRLGKRTSLSTELLYRSSFFTLNRETTFNPSAIFHGIVYETQHNRQSSLSLPVKFNMAFKKDPKFSWSIGAGISHLIATNFDMKRVEGPENGGKTTTNFPESSFNWGYFDLNVSFTAGFFYCFTPQTSIGLEYTFEKALEPNYYFYPNVFFPPIDNLSIEPITQPNFNSFSVSLRHNILE